MIKNTANYTYSYPNFVIQNLVSNQCNTDLLSILHIAKNNLQSSFPTTLSKYLLSELGEIHKFGKFEETFLFAPHLRPISVYFRKGDSKQNYYLAKEYFERILSHELGEYAFAQPLLIPDIEINEIIGEENSNFINQQVDFYFPQAKLVIEIDGQQHKLDEVKGVSDKVRDKYLLSKGIATIRISTTELQDRTYIVKIQSIIEHLEKYKNHLNFHKSVGDKIEKCQMSEEEIKMILLPTAIIRFQILLLELLSHNYLTFDEDWNFNVLISNQIETDIIKNITYRDEMYGMVECVGLNALELAINDLLIRIDELWQLKNKQELKKPNFNIEFTNNIRQFQPKTKTVNIDFSLFKRYNDENKFHEDVIFVRTDNFDIVKDKTISE